MGVFFGLVLVALMCAIVGAMETNRNFVVFVAEKPLREEQWEPIERMVREMSFPAFVTIDYTNWFGERRRRRIRPIAIRFTANEWHPQVQWLLEAHDLGKDEVRMFAMAQIHSWVPDKVTVNVDVDSGTGKC